MPYPGAGCTTGVLAQTPLPTQFSGVINDYSPSTSSPMGPWEMRGPWSFDVERSSRHGRFYGDLDDGTVRLHAKLFEYRCHDRASSSRMQHTHHITIAGRHSHANSYRRVHSDWPGQRYERWEPSAICGVHLICHYHRRNQRRIFEHHAAIRGWCAGSFRVAVDPRRGWQPDHGRYACGADTGHHNCCRDPAHFDDESALGGAGRRRVDKRLRKLDISVRGSVRRQTTGYPADCNQSQSNGRFCKWTGTVPGSTGDYGREGRHFDESRDHVDLPAIGNIVRESVLQGTRLGNSRQGLIDPAVALRYD